MKPNVVRPFSDFLFEIFGLIRLYFSQGKHVEWFGIGAPYNLARNTSFLNGMVHVSLMSPGVGLLYSGLLRRGNALSALYLFNCLKTTSLRIKEYDADHATFLPNRTLPSLCARSIRFGDGDTQVPEKHLVPILYKPAVRRWSGRVKVPPFRSTQTHALRSLPRHC